MRLRLQLPLLLLALLVSSSAAAQTTTDVSYVTLTIGTGFKAAFNQEFCQNETMSVSYEVTALVSQMKLAIFVTEGSCPDTPSASDKALFAESTVDASNQAGTLQFAASKLIEDCPARTTKDFIVCAVVKAPNYSTYGTTTTDQVLGKSSLALQYDSVQPVAPSLSSPTGGDSKLFLEWDTQAGIDSWTVYYRKTGKGPPDGGDSICAPLSDQSDAGAVAGDAGAGGPGGAGEPDACEPMTDQAFCDQKNCEYVGFDNCGKQRTVLCGKCASTEVCGKDGVCATPAGADAGLADVDGGAAGDTGLGSDAGPDTPAFDPTGWPDNFVFVDGAATSGDLRGLVNDQDYELVLVATDNAGNVSPGSAIRKGTPFVVQDFYRRYRCAGGTETGGFGCSTAGMLAVPGAAFAMLALLRRRRGA